MTQQGFPQISSPMVDPQTGRINQVWLQLFISMWTRTGGGAGISSDSITFAALAAPVSANPKDDPLMAIYSSTTESPLQDSMPVLPNADDHLYYPPSYY